MGNICNTINNKKHVKKKSGRSEYVAGEGAGAHAHRELIRNCNFPLLFLSSPAMCTTGQIQSEAGEPGNLLT